MGKAYKLHKALSSKQMAAKRVFANPIMDEGKFDVLELTA